MLSFSSLLDENGSSLSHLFLSSIFVHSQWVAVNYVFIMLHMATQLEDHASLFLSQPAAAYDFIEFSKMFVILEYLGDT